MTAWTTTAHGIVISVRATLAAALERACATA
jgi:hypothetical protein